MRNAFADTFYDLAKQDARLCALVADISPAGSMGRFRQDFPDRFINTGVAEQVMIGLAAGMAQRGLRPFAYTIATFSLFRPYEMVRDDLCYQDLPVTVVGIGAGVTYSTLGATHHAMEDVSLACGLPNMSVFAPTDPAETAAITRHLALHSQHPAYLRLAKAGEPDLTSNAASPLVIGKARLLRTGRGMCFLAYGPAPVRMAIELSDRYGAAKGVAAAVVAVHRLKPLDLEGLAELLAQFDHLVIIEEHVPHGGLGSQVKQLAWDVRASCQLSHFSLKDAFMHVYGDHEQLLAAHGLSVAAIASALDLP